jgi:formylglycine-generating enzyme required for sulfatase activity
MPQGPEAPAPLPSTTADIPPELARLQGYEIVKELGRGGMGVVYLARNRLMGRLEVLKVMNKALVGQADAVARFLQEIQSAARLNHPNVATAHSAHQVGDLLVLAMEYVDGQDLAKVVRERGPMPVAYACYCIHQAAVASQRGHELGLVHRDLKPGNILLAKQGKRAVVKVIDFGLAKAKSEVTHDQALTPTNAMMGTAGYTAPEQLLDARNADTRSDIYSLGCTLYCLLSGHAPFRGQTMYAVLLAQQAGAMQPLREVRPEVPEELAAVVAKMMARNPADRYGRPADVAAALLPFVKGGRPSGESDARPRAVADVPNGPPGRNAATSFADAGADRLSVKRKAADAARRRHGGPGRHRLALLSAATLLVGFVLFGAYMLRVRTLYGTVVIENVPSGAEVRVDDEQITVGRKGDTVTMTTLSEGPHRLKVLQRGIEILSSDVTVKLGGQPLRLRVEQKQVAAKSSRGEPTKPFREHPPPLDCTGPDGVSATGVRKAQEAWAQCLGRKVEETVEIGDGVTITFVLVPPGKFRMGSPESEAERSKDETLHTVILTEPFDLGKYEVTQAQYAAVVSGAVTEALRGKDKDPSDFKGGDLPVENVSWEEADLFGKELSKKLSDRHVYRMPTESEWEYSCRGGRPSSQPFGIGDGNLLSSADANVASDKIKSVGSFGPNALGLYDMHGNVWEWSADRYGPYPDGEVTNPFGADDPKEAPNRVIRGGSWNSSAGYCRAANRTRYSPVHRYRSLGFRLARSIPSGKQ